MKIYDSMDDLTADLDKPTIRERFAARFPRLAYYYGSPAVWQWAGLWFAGALLWHLAERRILPHALWLAAVVWLIGGFLGIAAEAWHAVTCPCVTASKTAPWDYLPEDETGEGE